MLVWIGNMKQLSLLQQRRLAAPHESDEELVRALARELIEDLGLKPPVDFKILASSQGIARVEITDIPWAGCLIQDRDAFVIKIRASDPVGRRRFTQPHEICHTFFPGFELRAQYRCAPTTALSTRSRDIEWLCDVGASELLFPRGHFLEDMGSLQFGLEAVESLADRYEASLEATAHRYVNLAQDDSMLLILEVGLKPSEKSSAYAEPKLRVQSVHHEGEWPYVFRHKSAPSDSPLVRALEGEIVHEVTDLYGMANDPIEGVEMSARIFPYMDGSGIRRERVIALLRRRASV